MYKEYFFVRILDLICITACGMLTVMSHKSGYFFLAAVILFILSFVLPSYAAKGIPEGHLRRCAYGNVILSVFPVSLLLSIIMLAVMIIEFENFSWSGLIIYVLVTFLVLLVFFWVGIIFVYTSSLQLGVDKRVIGLLCGMVPVANLIALRMIVKVTGREVREESIKYWVDKERENDAICATKYPLLMVHGVFFRDSEHLNYWGRVPEELKKNGAVIYYGGQESAGDVRTCAVEIKEIIDKITEETGCEKVNIIAHSKGGLDSRYAITMLGAAPKVASLTTINTPHKGCEFADYLLSKAPEALKNSVAAAYNKGAAALGDKKPDFIKAVTDLTHTGATALNEEMAPNDGVFDAIYTQSFGSKLNRAVSGKFPLNLSYNFVKSFDGDNDGLVGERACSWGSEFHFIKHEGRRGISHADMIDLNRENIEGFDIREFYVQIVHGLKERGL